MPVTYIYGIRDIEIDKYIYIGKSNAPKHRYGGLNNSHNDCVRELVERKGEDSFQVEILETVEFKAYKDWAKQEKFWVVKLRKEGHPLCNKNDGGGGPTKQTEEWKQAMSERISGENAPWYGKHLPERVRAKISKSKTGKKSPKSEETRLNLSRALTGREITWGDKISQALTGRKVSEIVRAKIAKASAKPFPAFYNTKTGEHIPAGQNLIKLCRIRNLAYENMRLIARGQTKQTRAGWMLATTIVKGDSSYGKQLSADERS